MAIKMVVTDLDRTLLKDDKTISDYTAGVLEGLRRRGILFAIATARPVRAVRDWLGFLRFDAAVYHNGAVIMAGGELLKKFGIEKPREVVQRILAERPECKISVEAMDRLYSNMDAEELWPGAEYVRTEDFHQVEGLVADKLLINAGSVQELEEWEKYVPEGAYLQLSENTVAMMMNGQATKPNGIRLLCEHYEISLEEVAAFGDDYNDMEMLRACGTGIAVANALPEVKAVAGGVCPSNEEDGVARWLEENIILP